MDRYAGVWRKTLDLPLQAACVSGEFDRHHPHRSQSDPQPRSVALQKFAEADAQRQMAQTEQASTEAVGRLRDLTLTSSRVAKMKEFPAVHWEYRATGPNDKPIYIVRDMVFAGNTMIDVISTSLGVEVARRNGSDFVAVMQIEDFAPPARQ
ncbi:hypothetical protein BCCGELA001_24440 [Bradyrhizobium sp. CCGE-LA001]|nr:hypothetical protein BCCGELA001_24440 [Bradyrhizobium sp. CCGE-LA001]